jgi:hypothetical protein
MVLTWAAFGTLGSFISTIIEEDISQTNNLEEIFFEQKG